VFHPVLFRSQYPKKRRYRGAAHERHAEHDRRRDGHHNERKRTRPAAEPKTFERQVFDCPANERSADESVHAYREPEQHRRLFRTYGQGRGKNNGSEQYSGAGLTKPKRMVGYGLSPCKFGGARRGIEEPPVAADRALKSALPWLIESFDDIHVEILALAQRKHVLNDARLVRGRWQRPLTHAAGTWPTDFSNQDILARKCIHHLTANCLHVRRCIAGRNWKILPVRQDMNGNKVDRIRDLPIAQPEFPNIRISHWHVHPRLDRADRMGEIGRGHIAAQQDLIAHDDRTDRVRIPVRESYCGFDLDLAFDRAAG